MNRSLLDPSLERISAKPRRSNLWAWIIAAATFALVAGLWLSRDISGAEWMYRVPQMAGPLPLLETTWLYLYLHLVTVLPVLALSFDHRVQYYRSWRYLFPAVTLVAAVFIIWDVIFTTWRVWGFNEQYFIGLEIAGLPLEEWMFFFTVPFASLFIYECLNVYVKKDGFRRVEKWLTPALIFGCLAFGLISWEAIYPATTFLLTAGLLTIHYLYIKTPYRSRFYLAYLVVWVPFIVIDGALTGGFTQEPVVLYHPEEFWGWRIGSVPMEDAVYNFLMLLGITTLFEKFRKKAWN